jgi:hypothetical protein
MGDRIGAYKVLVWKPGERDHSEDPGVDGRIILKKDLQEVDWGCVDWNDLASDRDK